MLDLALAGKRTQSFMYVSTAYSHCYNQDIEEKFYQAPTDMDSVYELIKADEASPNGLPEHVMKLKLGKWPNSYCFTKSLAEDLVRQYGETAPFPCAIYRPSIVTCSLSEPLDGWVGNVNGPAYIFMGTGLGAVHVTYYLGYPMDLIPADLANKRPHSLDLRSAREMGLVAVLVRHQASEQGVLFRQRQLAHPHVQHVEAPRQAQPHGQKDLLLRHPESRLVQLLH
ncbi:unnamed protein product [Trichogramma brassicae]|uniref:Fatty acyl-CoA reductase n=1 Tax=Trichogramma brassicae TaxID=86971 RepID=A0A6H5I4R0_9HYME|nr:unnamed protein product [Trichogramma brassicae]